MIEEDALGAGVNDPEMDVDVLVFYIDSSADEHPEVRSKKIQVYQTYRKNIVT
jgi:hypothetical protein